MKEASEKAGLKLNVQKTKQNKTKTQCSKNQDPVPSLYGKELGKQWKE